MVRDYIKMPTNWCGQAKRALLNSKIAADLLLHADGDNASNCGRVDRDFPDNDSRLADYRRKVQPISVAICEQM